MLQLQHSEAYTVGCTVIVVDEAHNCFLIAVLHVTEILISAVYYKFVNLCNHLMAVFIVLH